MDNTYCKNCMFAESADSEESCSMKIIDSIKDSKSITVKENYNYINNYACKYGLSKETYFKHYDEFQKIDIKSYILNKKLLSYYLVVDFTNSSFSIKECCETINGLTILPNFISFVFYNNNDSKNIINNTDFFWINTPERLIDIKNKDSITNINYIVNVLQPSGSFLKFNNSIDYYDGLFLTFFNYKNMKEHFKKPLDLCLEELAKLNQDNVIYYED